MKILQRTVKVIAASLATAMLTAGSAMAETPKQGGTLVLGTYQTPRHLNGAVQSGMATAIPSTQLFASLLRYDDHWNPQPYLAESWQWSDDALALTLKLRSNAVFHDGEPVTSEDVAFSLGVVKDNHPFKSMFEAVENIETPDPHTVVIHLSQPHPALLIALSPPLSPILPKHIYGDGQDVKSHPRNSNDVVGSGPFKLQKFEAGKEVILERFDDYFLENQPYLDRVVVQINPEQLSLFIGLERGDVQLLPYMSDPTLLRRARGNDNIQILDKGYEGVGALAWVAFNTEKEPFDNPKVRQAFAYVLDKEFIARAFTGGFATPAISPIVSASPYFNPDVNPYKVDLEKAEALLDEAGFEKDANGERMRLTLDYQPAGTLNKNIAEYLKAQLRKIGVTADMRTSADFPSWTRMVANRDYEITVDSVWNWGDPVIGVHRSYLSSNILPIVWTNTHAYVNPKVDELLEAAGKEPDLEKRKELYNEFQQIVVDDAPVIYTVELPYHTMATPSVQNVPTNIWGPLSPYDEVYLK